MGLKPTCTSVYTLKIAQLASVSTRCSHTFALYSDWIVWRSWVCNMTAPLCTPVGLCVNGAIDGLMSARYTWVPCIPAQSRSSMITDVIWPSTYFAAKLRKRKSPWTGLLKLASRLSACLKHKYVAGRHTAPSMHKQQKQPNLWTQNLVQISMCKKSDWSKIYNSGPGHELKMTSVALSGLLLNVTLASSQLHVPHVSTHLDGIRKYRCKTWL